MAVLVALDLVLIAISAGYGALVALNTVPMIPDILNIGRDHSIAEVFNFAKWGGLIALFLWAYHSQRQLIFVLLAVVFALILGDDSLQLHEKMGGYTYIAFGATSGNLTAIGEIGFWIVLGMVCLGILLIAWPRTPTATKDILWPLAVLFGGVVVCGMGVDLLHLLAPEKSVLGGVIGLVEDGGEMIFISLMLAYAFARFAPPLDA